MRELLTDILEINVILLPIVLLLCIFGNSIRKRYGARCLRILWILVLIRWLIPINMSFGILNFQLPFFNTGNESSIESEQDSSVLSEGMAPAENLEDGIEKVDTDNSVYGKETESAANGTVAGVVSGEVSANNSPIEHTPEDSALISDDAYSQNSQPEAQMTSENGENHLEAVSDFKRINVNLYILLVSVWLIGCGVFFAVRIIQYFKFAGNFYIGLQPCTDRKLVRRIMMLEKKHLGHCRIKIYQKENLASPMLLGCIRPKLIISDGETDLEQLDFIVLHELCHYKNKDLWVKWLVIAVQIVNWFNPLVYIMRRELLAVMEYACDSYALESADSDQRADYAELVLAYARKDNCVGLFGTSFYSGKRKMKRRIDNMMDEGNKKKGTGIFALLFLMILAAGLLVSCGDQESTSQEEGKIQSTETEIGQEAEREEAELEEAELEADMADQQSAEAEAQQKEAELEEATAEQDQAVYAIMNLEHGYNKRLRMYNGNTYIATKMGIYCISSDGEESLIYENVYSARSNIAIYDKYLYFSGTRENLTEMQGVICRMDLETYETEVLSEPIDSLTGIYIYNDCLYAGTGLTMIGYELDADGKLGIKLDCQSEDFIYYEYNAYMDLESQLIQTEAGSAEWEAICEQKNQMYHAIVDVSTAKRLLLGKQIVALYKDEITSSLYIEDEDGNYEFLCDVYAGEAMVTDQGVYYWKYDKGICYMDYATKTERVFYNVDGVPSLLTYDLKYIYYTFDTVDGIYLMRQAIEGGEPEKITDAEKIGEDAIRTLSMTTRYAIDNQYLYLIDYDGGIEKIELPE